MDEQMIENFADILVVSIMEERKFGNGEHITLAAARPMVIRLFGEQTWDEVEEKTREFVWEIDAQASLNG